MNAPLLLVGLALVGIVWVLVPVAGDAVAWYRGPRRVRCPETGADVEVGFDLRRAALGATLGRPMLRIARCALWPGRRGCRQACVGEAADRGSLASGPGV
jgi:hypothetical protein